MPDDDWVPRMHIPRLTGVSDVTLWRMRLPQKYINGRLHYRLADVTRAVFDRRGWRMPVLESGD